MAVKGGTAPGFSIRVKGEEELRRKLGVLGENAERMAIEAMKEGAEIVKKSAQQKVVGGPGGAIGKQITVEVVGT